MSSMNLTLANSNFKMQWNDALTWHRWYFNLMQQNYSIFTTENSTVVIASPVTSNWVFYSALARLTGSSFLFFCLQVKYAHSHPSLLIPLQSDNFRHDICPWFDFFLLSPKSKIFSSSFRKCKNNSILFSLDKSIVILPTHAVICFNNTKGLISASFWKVNLASVERQYLPNSFDFCCISVEANAV